VVTLTGKAKSAAEMDLATKYVNDVNWEANRTDNDEMEAIADVVMNRLSHKGLVIGYGSPIFTKETHEAKIGPLDLSVKDKQTVNVPGWAGVGVVVIGGTLQVVGAGKENR